MAEQTTVKVKCPHCGARVNASVVEVLHPGSPELTLLFKGQLNRQLCSKCQTAFLVDRQLIYSDHNPESPYILYLTDVPEDNDLESIESQVDSMATEVFMKENLPRPTVRVTFWLYDFIEKIAIRQLGMDDRLIEYAKLQLFRTVDEMELSRSTHRLLLDYSHCNDDVLAFFVFDRETCKPINALHAPMSEFKQLEEQLKKDNDMLMELEAAFPSCYVSADKLL